MKLQNYIVEEEKGLAYYIPKIQAECKPFLKDIKGAAGTLFRHDTKNRNKPIWKKITRKNRDPLDTPTHIHNAINDIFLKKFGWKARSQGLFCWSNKFISHFLLGKWMVFPAGNYKYLWSTKVDDLWAALGDIASINAEKNVEYFEDHFLNTYYNDKIKMSFKYEHEIMVKCDYSYLVKVELMEQVNEMLALNWQGPMYRGRIIP